MILLAESKTNVHVHYDYDKWHGAYAIVTAKGGTIYHGILASWLDGHALLFDWLTTADDDAKEETSMKKAVLFDVGQIDTLVGYMRGGLEVMITSYGLSSLTSRCGMVEAYSLEMAQQLEVECDAQ